MVASWQSFRSLFSFGVFSSQCWSYQPSLLTCMEPQNGEWWMLADNISHVRLYENENIFMYVRPSVWHKVCRAQCISLSRTSLVRYSRILDSRMRWCEWFTSGVCKICSLFSVELKCCPSSSSINESRNDCWVEDEPFWMQVAYGHPWVLCICLSGLFEYIIGFKYSCLSKVFATEVITFDNK